MKPYSLSLHLFRRDLRLQDNSALLLAHQQSERVIPCFIFDERQIKPHAFQSKPGLDFMMQSLLDLQHDIEKRNGHFYYFYGTPEMILEKLLQTLPIDAVFFNRDYTPFSKQRDQKLISICEQYKRKIEMCDDALLHTPESILKSDGTPYTIFTPFYKKASQHFIANPQTHRYTNFYTQPISFSNKTIFEELFSNIENWIIKGGRHAALNQLKNLPDLKSYAQDRNILEKKATSHLSPHLKFGTLSPRECYHFIKKMAGVSHSFITELHWRDFFTQIAFHFPKVFGNAFHDKFANITWINSEKYFEKWCHGQTGFPVVDAGMRELNQTGYMHNRARMITASFLVKDLHIDWRWGERYFATRLLDYDPAVNNGNWQWAASTGCDAQPYFRIFNPWLQQKKFDPDALYIKRFIPELKNISPEHIHAIADKNIFIPNYPKPLIQHQEAIKMTKELYRL